MAAEKRKGFRMAKARDNRGQSVLASQSGNHPEPFERSLTCRYCDVGVKCVPTYFKAKDTPHPYEVRGHFVILPNQEHAPDCACNPLRILEEIARGSAGLASVDTDGKLRLVLPHDLGATGPQPPVIEPSPAEPDDLTALRITTTGPVLPPALNSAVKIVQLLAANGFSNEAMGRFVIQHGTREVPWARFCYHRPTVPTLYRTLASGRPVGHPIAVYGTVERCGVSKNGPPYAVLASRVPLGDGRTVDVLLYTNFRSLLGHLRRGVHVLAVDNWGLLSGARPLIRVWDDHWQIASWTTDPTTGEPSPARCPNPDPPPGGPPGGGAPPPRDRQRRHARPEAREASPEPAPAARETTAALSGSAVPPAGDPAELVPDPPEQPPAIEVPSTGRQRDDHQPPDPGEQSQLAPAPAPNWEPSASPADGGTGVPVLPRPAFPPRKAAARRRKPLPPLGNWFRRRRHRR
jgi:hypothetical protein